MFDLGDPVPLTFEVDGPATVTLVVELPDGTETAPVVSNPGSGRYTAAPIATQAGLHRVRWTATGALTDAFTDVFNVAPASNMQVISLQDAKDHLNMTETVNDEELRTWIAVAARVVERHTGLTIARREFTERVTGPAFRLPRTPLLTIESPSGVEITDAASGECSGPKGSYDVVYTAGYRVVPDNYLGAVAIIAAHLFDTQRASSVGRGQVTLGGDDTLSPSGLGFAMPDRAVQLLGARAPSVA